MMMYRFLFKCKYMFLQLVLLGVTGCKTSNFVNPRAESEYSQIQTILQKNLSCMRTEDILATRVSLAGRAVSDYFGFKAALGTYNEGVSMGKTADFCLCCNVLANASYFNLHDAAYIDGIYDGLIKREDAPKEAIKQVATVRCQRISFGKTYWASHSRTAIEVRSALDQGNESLADFYARAWREYCRGYVDAFLLAYTNNRFPFAQANNCVVIAPSDKYEERAYVYGWWSGSYDCYRESTQDDLGIVLLCRRTIDSYLEIERQFWEEWEKSQALGESSL